MKRAEIRETYQKLIVASPDLIKKHVEGQTHLRKIKSTHMTIRDILFNSRLNDSQKLTLIAQHLNHLYTAAAAAAAQKPKVHFSNDDNNNNNNIVHNRDRDDMEMSFLPKLHSSLARQNGEVPQNFSKPQAFNESAHYDASITPHQQSSSSHSSHNNHHHHVDNIKQSSTMTSPIQRNSLHGAAMKDSSMDISLAEDVNTNLEDDDNENYLSFMSMNQNYPQQQQFQPKHSLADELAVSGYRHSPAFKHSPAIPSSSSLAATMTAPLQHAHPLIMRKQQKRARDSLESNNPHSLKRLTTKRTLKKLNRKGLFLADEPLPKTIESPPLRNLFNTSHDGRTKFNEFAYSTTTTNDNNNNTSHHNNSSLRRKNRTFNNSSIYNGDENQFNESRELGEVMEEIRRQSKQPNLDFNKILVKDLDDPNKSMFTVKSINNSWSTMVNKPKAFTKARDERQQRFLQNRNLLSSSNEEMEEEMEVGEPSTSYRNLANVQTISPQHVSRSGFVRGPPMSSTDVGFLKAWKGYSYNRRKDSLETKRRKN